MPLIGVDIQIPQSPVVMETGTYEFICPEDSRDHTPERRTFFADQFLEIWEDRIGTSKKQHKRCKKKYKFAFGKQDPQTTQQQSKRQNPEDAGNVHGKIDAQSEKNKICT